MQDEIVKTGLLGTNRASFQLAGDLNEIGSKVSSSQKDKEDAFLISAAITFLYAESGLEAEEGKADMPVCPQEIKAELSGNINQYIADALAGRDDVWFDFVIAKANQAGKLVSAKMVPLILNKALEQRQKREKIVSVCGELGKWLCMLNPAWMKLNEKQEEDADWETGSLEQRKLFLRRLREVNPSEALDLLKSSFAQENAANRVEFIEVLQTGLSIHDEPFLLEVLNDKSKKVKEAALSLLQPLEGSSINQLYLDHLTRAFQVKEERHLLLLKKKVLYFDASVLPSGEIFKIGIEKVSSEKGVEDVVFQTAQMLAFVNPRLLAQNFNLPEEDWISLLLEQKDSVIFKPFLLAAAIRFKNKLLAEKILDSENGFDIRLMEIIDEDKRLQWFEKYLDSHFTSVLEMLLDQNYSILPVQLSESKGSLQTHIRLRNPIISDLH